MKRYKFMGDVPLFKVGDTVKLNKDFQGLLSPFWGPDSTKILTKGSSYKVVGQDWSTHTSEPIYVIQGLGYGVEDVPEVWLEREV